MDKDNKYNILYKLDLPNEIIDYIIVILKHKNKTFLGVSCNHPRCLSGENEMCCINKIKNLILVDQYRRLFRI